MQISKNEFTNAIKTLIKSIGEDPNREGLTKTPDRVYESFKDIFGGYKENPDEILKSALFNSKNNEMVLIKDIEFYSICEHHILPIIGRAHIAYIPSKKVVGLSKIPRIVDVFAKRMQIQEELTEEIAECIMSSLNPKGVGVVIQARHMCMEMRGVKKNQSSTTSSALRGQFLEDRTRSEFFSLINSNLGSRY